MVGHWGGIFFVLFGLFGFLNLASGQEEFRAFTAASGQAFTGRVLSYEGQIFYIEGKDKKLYPVPFKQLSAPDQKYLIEIAQAGKIPKGDPRTLKLDDSPAKEPAVSDAKEVEKRAEPVEKPKPSFRSGSFFAYKPVNLGQDPSITLSKRWIEEGAKESAVGGEVASTDMSKGISFHDHIFPLIEERCLDCHSEPYVKNGRTIHPKAGLRLDTYESIIEGNLDGTIVEKGNADESTLYAVITLDSDDPEIMPPKGDPLTEEEINMFKQWIIEGAKENPSDTFEQSTEEIAVTQEIGGEEKEASIVDQLARRLKAPSKPQMEAAQKSGALVSLLSTRHSMVRAEFSSGPISIKDDAIGALSGIKNNISHLDLSRTSVTDNVLGEVKKFNNLTWLNLKNTSVTDRGIQSLSKMPYLTYLNLVSSKITDNSINTLASLKTLEEVYLWNSDVSARGVSQLRKALPHAKILH